MGRPDTGPAGARTGAGCRVPSPPAAGRGLIASVCVWLLSSSKCVSHAYKQSCLKMQTTEVSANYIKCIDHRFSPNSVMFLFYIAAASCGPSAFLAADSEIHPNAPRLPGGRAGLRVGSDGPSARIALCGGHSRARGWCGAGLGDGEPRSQHDVKRMERTRCSPREAD